MVHIKADLNFPYLFFPLQDTAGQEKFHALGPIYYRDADGPHLKLHLYIIFFSVISVFDGW